MDATPDGGTCAGEAKGFAELDRTHGFVPVIAWAWMNFGDEEHSPKLQDVVAGKYDWYLDDWIKGVSEFKSPIFIRPSHEMDGDWYPYSEGYKKDPTRNTAADYIAYWKYVVDRFRKAGVNNVAWVWCVNGDRSGGKDWPDYYPGDDYTDWLAIDLYSARNPKDVVGQFMDLYGKTGKPIMIPEGGTGPEQTKNNPHYSGDAAWVKELFDTIDSTPRIKRSAGSNTAASGTSSATRGSWRSTGGASAKHAMRSPSRVAPQINAGPASPSPGTPGKGWGP